MDQSQLSCYLLLWWPYYKPRCKADINAVDFALCGLAFRVSSDVWVKKRQTTSLVRLNEGFRWFGKHTQDLKTHTFLNVCILHFNSKLKCKINDKVIQCFKTFFLPLVWHVSCVIRLKTFLKNLFNYSLTFTFLEFTPKSFYTSKILITFSHSIAQTRVCTKVNKCSIRLPISILNS